MENKQINHRRSVGRFLNKSPSKRYNPSSMTKSQKFRGMKINVADGSEKDQNEKEKSTNIVLDVQETKRLSLSRRL